MATKITESENNEINNNNHKDSQDNILNQKKSSIDNDLLYIEASEETMEGFTLPKEFLKLDLDKIREFIEILEEHYQSCLKDENISLSKTVKQRIILLKRLEKEKMKIEANIIYSNQRELVQDKMQEELDNYIKIANQEYKSLLKVFETQEVEMLKNHQQEIDEFKKNFEKIYENKKPQPSKECLNWIKIREYALKQNKFEKANQANTEINKLMEKDLLKFNKNKEKKLNDEINKIKYKHNKEKNGLLLKKKSITDKFNQTKDSNLDQIKKKYDAKLKELKNYQNFEMANFDKITKGIAKPCARIQSIVTSTTGYREEVEDEKDDIKGKEDEKKQENGEEKNENNENNYNSAEGEEEGEGEGEVEGEGEGEGEEQDNGNSEENEEEHNNQENELEKENDNEEHDEKE